MKLQNDKKDAVLKSILKLDRDIILKRIEGHGEKAFVCSGFLKEEEIKDYAFEFVDLFFRYIEGGAGDSGDDNFESLKQMLHDAANRMLLRGGMAENYLKFMHDVLNTIIEEVFLADGVKKGEVVYFINNIFYELTIHSFSIFLYEREKALDAQRKELFEVSAPITEIWDGVLTLPVIGALDTDRALDMMEKLLQRIALTRARVVLIDLTSITNFDTQNINHLIQVARAITLMGTKPIITGIRPELAFSMANLNLDLGGVQAHATISDGLKAAYDIIGVKIQ